MGRTALPDGRLHCLIESKHQRPSGEGGWPGPCRRLTVPAAKREASLGCYSHRIPPSRPELQAGAWGRGGSVRGVELLELSTCVCAHACICMAQQPVGLEHV